ncbi:MAG: 2-methylaconitate cis-trans isomerase PrpF [Moritella sp.]|uniref:2-methylaconitate cis-trans isomerase PrpF n=1 Tax=Moritella sp. TaxID=78556 RepID=UPI0029A4EAF9|nr:2-methylaconitate cis-trans isomerase PrpF [Moritella sp.]MDX2320376.1 2-methylaconitate cis-trans isomerase PrpF [Moritella sp.]
MTVKAEVQQSKYQPQIKIAATYMRGGTSKGVFFNQQDLPEEAQTAGKARDAILLRVIGSPDPYAKQTDGMGGATSSTSKTVIVSKSDKSDHDVDYLFGQVSIEKAFVDWSGNCGNLSSAVGAFAIHQGLIDNNRIPFNGHAVVRIWQANINKTIIAHVPIYDGEVQECGDFELDGVTFPSAEISIEFINPSDAKNAMFPTGKLIEALHVPGIGTFNVTMINAGIATVFLNANELGYIGTEGQEVINSDSQALQKFEAIRAFAAVKMGLIEHIDQSITQQHIPKIAFVSPAQDYISSSGKAITKQQINFNVRALSMGKLHHAMMGTAAVAIATAAAIPGTLVNNAAGGGNHQTINFGHPSGTLKVGAQVSQVDDQWLVDKAIMSRSARILMEGWVRVPAIEV